MAGMHVSGEIAINSGAQEVERALANYLAIIMGSSQALLRDCSEDDVRRRFADRAGAVRDEVLRQVPSGSIDQLTDMVPILTSPDRAKRIIAALVPDHRGE